MRPIPWFENNAMTAESRSRLLEALDEWKHVADKFVLVVRSRNDYSLSAFSWLMSAKPDNMTLIPGFKTFDSLSRYDDPFGWQAVAEHAALVCEYTGSGTVLLDNEKALEKYHHGQEQIDLARLAHGLEHVRDLPQTRTLWYQPQILGDDQRFLSRHAETTRLLRTVANAVPRSAFTVGFMARPGWEFNKRDEVAHMRDTRAIVSRDRMVLSFFVNTSGRLGSGPAYTPSEAMRQLVGDSALVYPGHGEWIACGRAWRAWRALRTWRAELNWL